VQKGDYDLILTGVQADDGCAQVGGMLALLRVKGDLAGLEHGIRVHQGANQREQEHGVGGATPTPAEPVRNTEGEQRECAARQN
jgi:hypothetical protein